MSEERPWSNNYPATLNDDTSMPDVEDYVVVIRASHLNSVKAAIIALETFMGKETDPAVGSCRKRLTDLEATSGTDEKVKITTDDTTQGFLWDKLVVSTGLTRTKLNAAANEQLQLEVSGLQAVDFNEEQFVTDGLETPGATVTHVLTNTPIGSSNSLSGKGIDVYRNGRRLEYNATPTEYDQYNYNVGFNRVEVLAAGEADEYEVVYISGGSQTPASFLELSDSPASYAGSGGYFVKVNPGADALEFSSSGGVSDFVGLGDTPANYTDRGSASLRVTSSADGVEFIKNNLTAVVAPTVDDDADAGYSVGSLWLDTNLNDAWYCFDNTNDAAVWSKGTAFWELTDTPPSAGSPNYVGYELNSVRINAAGDGVEYQKHKLDATAAPTVDNDVDENYTVGSRWLDVSNQKEYVCLDNTDGAAVWLEGGGGGGGGTFASLTDTPANFTDAGLNTVRVNSGEDGVSFLKHKMDATADPTVNDGAGDGYEIGSRWHRVDAGNEKIFICLKNTDPDQAIWQEVGGGGASSLDTAYDGGDNITVDGNPVTLNRTQSADDQESLEINHDFNSSQGAAIRVTGSNTGDGTPNSETIRISDVTIVKKIPATLYEYRIKDSSVIKREAGGSWSLLTIPDSPNDLRYIHGTNINHLFICGDNSNLGYIAVDTGSGFERINGHSTYGTHPYDGVAQTIMCVYAVSTSEIWTQSYNSGQIPLIHKWDPTNGWVLKYTAAYQQLSYRNFSKSGNVIILPQSNKYYYSLDGGENWSVDSTTFSSCGHMDIDVNPANGRFRCAAIKNWGLGYASLKVWEGIPEGTGGDAWTEIGHYDHGSGIDYGNMSDGRVIYIAPNGETFALASASNNAIFVYDFDGTPTGVSGGGYPKGLAGLSDTYVVFNDNTYGSGGAMRVWDGVTLTAVDLSTIQQNAIDYFLFESSSGTGAFGGHKVSFSGSAGDNDAFAYEVGGGATHALKAVSGKIELDNGVVILGKQSETPTTPSGRGIIYTKEVSGETEFFYLGTDGNEVQLTSGGSIIGSSVGREQNWSSPGTDALGDPIVFNNDTALDATPLIAANMAAGYDIQAYMNGVRMIHNNPPAATNEFYYNSATNKVELYASGGVDRYDVAYRSVS